LSKSSGSKYRYAGNVQEAKRLELQAKIFNELLEKEVEMLDLKPGMKVLDAGCGTGTVARMIAGKVHPSEVYGIDADSLFISKAKTLAASQGIDNIRFEIGDIENIDYADNTFDLAYCRLVLTHKKNPAKLIAELKRVTRKGGKVAASEYDDGTIVYYPEMPKMNRIWNRYGQREKKGGRDRYFGRKLFSVFTEAGLNQVAIHLLPIHATQQNPEMLKIFMLLNLRAFLTSDNYEELMKEVSSFLSHPGAFLMGVTFYATGFVP